MHTVQYSTVVQYTYVLYIIYCTLKYCTTVLALTRSTKDPFFFWKPGLAMPFVFALTLTIFDVARLHVCS